MIAQIHDKLNELWPPSFDLKPLLLLFRGDAMMFSPWSKSPWPVNHHPPDQDPVPDHGPTPDPTPVEQPPPIDDQVERFLVLLFLRRYRTSCPRR